MSNLARGLHVNFEWLLREKYFLSFQTGYMLYSDGIFPVTSRVDKCLGGWREYTTRSSGNLRKEQSKRTTDKTCRAEPRPAS